MGGRAQFFRRLFLFLQRVRGEEKSKERSDEALRILQALRMPQRLASLVANTARHISTGSRTPPGPSSSQQLGVLQQLETLKAASATMSSKYSR